ncbi:hypothetical protein IMY05_C5091002800 [Salix suchowensis]|nr:hypothetical protein IMY05_C5091002800 [Salix suchowensis]
MVTQWVVPLEEALPSLQAAALLSPSAKEAFFLGLYRFWGKKRGDESVTGDYVSSEEQSEAGSFQEAEAKGKKNIYFDGTDDGLFSWFLLVTILVAAKGVYQVPAIRSTEDMQGALRSLNVDAKELEVVTMTS